MELKNYKLEFKGEGTEFFGLVIVNWLLTVVTLGIYYPWAKVKKMKYLFESTYFNGTSFQFHGTGKEMFKGFIKAILIFASIYGLLLLFIYLDMAIIGAVLFYLIFLAILPIAIHGSYKYRMSRTSWRGIRFGYTGDRKELCVNFIKWLGLTIVTFGVYGSWFIVNLRSFIFGNIKFGDIDMQYKGRGSEYFLINLKGYFLSILTLGIYMFWWQKELFEYFINNVSLHKEEKSIKLKSTVEAGDLFILCLVNVIMLIFSLGLAYAWVEMRTMKYLFSNIQMTGDIDLDAITQKQENYKDATGEDIEDMLDMDFVM
jgi:uncharacterized membrane protein YjgN (DUF898 family)